MTCTLLDDRLVEGIKSSPHNGPGTPRDDGTPGNGEMGYGSLHYQDGINPVTVCIYQTCNFNIFEYK